MLSSSSSSWKPQLYFLFLWYWHNKFVCKKKKKYSTVLLTIVTKACIYSSTIYVLLFFHLLDTTILLPFLWYWHKNSYIKVKCKWNYTATVLCVFYKNAGIIFYHLCLHFSSYFLYYVFIHSNHLGCFHTLAIANYIAVNREWRNILGVLILLIKIFFIRENARILQNLLKNLSRIVNSLQ